MTTDKDKQKEYSRRYYEKLIQTDEDREQYNAYHRAYRQDNERRKQYMREYMRRYYKSKKGNERIKLAEKRHREKKKMERQDNGNEQANS